MLNIIALIVLNQMPSDDGVFDLLLTKIIVLEGKGRGRFVQCFFHYNGLETANEVKHRVISIVVIVSLVIVVLIWQCQTSERH